MAFCDTFTETFQRRTPRNNCNVIRTFLAGFEVWPKPCHRSPTGPAALPSSVCGASLTIWPITDITSGERSFSARTSRLTTGTCQYRFHLLSQDIPPHDRYLPIPLSPEVDQILDHKLRQTDDLLSNALLLLRATGIRVGECLRLNRDSLRHLGGNQWALHVPLGKLHNERWVPVDDDARKIFARILALTGPDSSDLPEPSSPLLLLPNGKTVSYSRISAALKKTAKRAGSPPPRLHQLRHTYATVMLRAGISLTALKEILGHHDIRMTMRYVQVTQNDLQRQYQLARQNMASVHSVPQLQTTHDGQTDNTGIAAICCALDAVKHQLEMHRRQLATQPAKTIQSLARRLVKLRAALAALQIT